MTLIVVSTDEQQSLSLAAAGRLIDAVDATWRVGAPGGSARALTTLFERSRLGVDALRAIVVCLTVSSFTTRRTTASFVNALAWSRSIPLSEVTDPDPASIIRRLAAGEPFEAVTALFPSYPTDSAHSSYTTLNGPSAS